MKNNPSLDRSILLDHSQLATDPRWQVAERIAASRGFIKSRFLTSFLLYICEKHLLGQTDEITEQQIGEQAFQRPRGYNPGDDNIVRNYARILRQRLEEYFNGEGIDEEIRIVVPRGAYVPLFIEENGVIGESKPVSAETEANNLDRALFNQDGLLTKQLAPDATRSTRALKFLCALLLAAVTFFLIHDLHLIRPSQTAAGRFWNVFLNPAKDTLIVPADSGLAIYQDLMKKRIHLAEYVGGEYQTNGPSPLGISPAIAGELGSRRYTSVVDLHLVLSLSQLPEVDRSRLRVRYAREVTLDDLKQSNVILLGSVKANPWVELFQKDMNFQFESPGGDDLIIHNLNPLPGEKMLYETNHADPTQTTFGVIAVTPNLDGTGHVLLIEGINMAGTEAAADYLFSDASAPLLQQIVDAKGNLQPFEVLLETSNIGANAPHPNIVAQRVVRRAQMH